MIYCHLQKLSVGQTSNVISRANPILILMYMSRFCPTLGWLHLVKNVSHRATVDVTLPVPIVVNVPDMWSRDEDKKLLQTIVKTIPLNDYNPTRIVLLCVSRDTSDIASEKKTTPSLPPRSSFVHRCICYRNPTCLWDR